MYENILLTNEQKIQEVHAVTLNRYSTATGVNRGGVKGFGFPILDQGGSAVEEEAIGDGTGGRLGPHQVFWQNDAYEYSQSSVREYVFYVFFKIQKNATFNVFLNGLPKNEKSRYSGCSEQTSKRDQSEK